MMPALGEAFFTSAMRLSGFLPGVVTARKKLRGRGSCAIFALSGAASVYGLSQKAAVNLAVQQINDWKYLGDSTLAVQFEDSAGDAKQAINAMTKLTSDASIVAVEGPTLPPRPSLP